MALPSIKNSVGMAVTAVADSGEGTITLGSALSGGYQTAATAYAADANIDIRVEEGNNWEVCRDCTYDHSELTVTRGTQEDGSSGTSTRVAFTTEAKVYVVESAERIRRTVGGYLEHASHDGTAAVTGVVGTMHVFTALTADRVFTLPASAQAGDRIGITFPAGSASFEILLKSASGDKINNVDCSSTEWSRLFIAGETVIFRCVDASTVDWIVEIDKRIPQQAKLSRSTNQSITGAGTFVLLQCVTSVFDNASIVSTADYRIIPRRSGAYSLNGYVIAQTTPDQKRVIAGVDKDGAGTASTGFGPAQWMSNSAALSVNARTLVVDQCTVGSYYQLYIYQDDTGAHNCSGDIALLEVL